ncbi:carbohydrate ABC transporter permease [Nonomuraea thailandensis]
MWRGTAFSMMLYSAALENVPPSHLETARLAGAGVLQQLRDVVLPLIRRHILTNLLLISLWTFNDFTPFVLTGAALKAARRSCPCTSTASRSETASSAPEPPSPSSSC